MWAFYEKAVSAYVCFVSRGTFDPDASLAGGL